MNNERAWTRAQRTARASYMNPKRKKRKRNIQIRQHNKTKLKHNCKPSQVVIITMIIWIIDQFLSELNTSGLICNGIGSIGYRWNHMTSQAGICRVRRMTSYNMLGAMQWSFALTPQAQSLPPLNARGGWWLRSWGRGEPQPWLLWSYCRKAYIGLQCMAYVRPKVARILLDTSYSIDQSITVRAEARRQWKGSS